MMKIIVHPSHRHLYTFLKQLPESFPNIGESIYKGRNEVRKFQDGGKTYAIKSFQVPHTANRIAYTFFRTSKAERSYVHACMLLEKGILTPQPIAFAEHKSGGLLSHSYYVSTFQDSPPLIQVLGCRPLNETKTLAESFACYTAQLHEKGILHKDYSFRNILFEEESGTHRFFLIDINRMKFVKMDEEKSAKNLCRLWCDDETFTFIVQVYVGKRGFMADRFLDKAFTHRQSYWTRLRRRHPDNDIFRADNGILP